MPQAQDPRQRRINPNTDRNRVLRQPERQGRPMPDRQRSYDNAQQRPQPRPRYQQAPQQQDDTVDMSSTIKGIIAVFLTLLIVIIIVMLFAKSLFVSDGSQAKNIKTGHLTETEFVFIEQPETKMNEEVVTTKKAKKKKTEKKEDTPALPDGLDTSVAGDYTVNDAVILHPEPNSSSAELAIVAYGSEVKVYGTANGGWYYLDYDGQLGYAWGTYFTKK